MPDYGSVRRSHLRAHRGVGRGVRIQYISRDKLHGYLLGAVSDVEFAVAHELAVCGAGCGAVIRLPEVWQRKADPLHEPDKSRQRLALH
jgi:hypothetical protein